MPKIVDHDEYRKEMIAKCFSIFTRKGYSGVTMREIAREIGVSTGTLYHYFPTKESMLDQMFTHVRETNVSEYIERMSADVPMDRKLEGVRDFWKSSREVYQNTMLLAIDMLRNGSPDSEKLFAEFSDHYTGAMAGNFGISLQFSRSIYMYFLGMIFHSLFMPRDFPYDRQVDIVTDILRTIFDGRDRGDDASGGTVIDHILTILSDNGAR